VQAFICFAAIDQLPSATPGSLTGLLNRALVREQIVGACVQGVDQARDADWLGSNCRYEFHVPGDGDK
jgi:hypothetical protein